MAGQPKKQAGIALLKQMGPDKVEELLEQGKSLEDVTKILKVTRKALYDWLDAPEQAGLLSRARVRAADTMATQTIEIADNVPEEASAIQKARLRSDNRKWLASKWNAAQYGDSKGVQVNVNLGELHLRAVKTVKPLQEPDDGVIEIDVAEQKPK